VTNCLDCQPEERAAVAVVPLFDLAQPTISHHLRVLRDAGAIECERQGLWSYYYVLPAALDEPAAWLGKSGHLSSAGRSRGRCGASRAEASLGKSQPKGESAEPDR
jgi:DNA-binding transcriptional ArsR family regulator